MSIIVRINDKIILFVKGADDIIFKYLSKES